MPRLNPLLRPLPLVLALQAALAGQAIGADFTVGAGTTQTTGQTLTDGSTGTVEADASLSTSGSSVAVDVKTGTSVLNNAGTIEQTGTARAVDANSGTPILTINNANSGVISSNGAAAIRLGSANGQYLIDNAGTISSAERAIHVNGASSSLILNNSGTISTSGASESALHLNAENGSYVINNAGTIEHTGTQRAIDANANGQTLVINNEATGVISSSGAQTIRLNKENGSYIIDNQGTIAQTGASVGGERAIKADLDYTSLHNQVINGAEDNRAAVISSTGNDALRLGSNFTLTNYGSIFSTGLVNTSCPAYMAASVGCGADVSAADGVAIENRRANVAILNHGSITGPRHGIDGGDPLAFAADSNLIGLEHLIIRSADGNGVTFAKVVDGVTTEDIQILNPVVINYAAGEIRGNNGSGVGLDGHGVVFNYGLISGNYAGAGNVYDHLDLGLTTSNGDGDGVDIDGIAYIENHGRIEGTGAGGFDSDGNPNGADGIAAGGGTIINHAGGEIFGQAKGILIDDGAAGTAVASGRGTSMAQGGVVRIDNAGSIIGADEAAIGLVGDFDDVLINHAGGTIRGGLDTTRVDEADSTTAAAAVQMGGGNDSLLNAGLIEGLNGLAVDLGDGDDSLTVLGSGRFVGLVDGGSGDDLLVLDDSAGGSFGNSINFERLDVRAGNWTLDSDDFSDNAHIFAGAGLRNLGLIQGNVQVDSGATYGGGHIGGNLTLASNSTLILQVDASGTGNGVTVDGSASLAGANLRIDALPGGYPASSLYNVLQANGGVSGTFANVSSNLAFLTPTLTYGSNSVDLELLRNGSAFADVAQSGNGQNVADALESQAGGPLYQALLTSSSAEAGQGLEQLAASSNASLASVSLASGAQLGNSMRSAMRPMGGANNLQAALLHDNGPLLAATGVPSSTRNLNDPQAQGRLWLQGLGSHGKLDGPRGGRDISQDTRGAVLGADWGLGSAWRLGVLGGYARTDIDAGSGASGDVDSLHLGVYAQHQNGPLAVRLGAAYSRHDNSSTRKIAFNGFSDRLRGDFDADSQQAFAELGYQLGSGRLAAEPFASLGYQRYSQESYNEKGGAAALHVDQQDQDNFSSTFGVRLAHLGMLDNGMSLTPRLSVAWRHTYGTLDSSVRQSFLSGGSAFSVEGSALDRNSLLLEAGLDLGISAGQSIGLGYSGEHGSHAQNHALVAQWQARF